MKLDEESLVIKGSEIDWRLFELSEANVTPHMSLDSQYEDWIVCPNRLAMDIFMIL